MDRRLLSFIVLIAASVSALNAAAIISGPISSCQSFATGSPNDLIVDFATFSNANFACEQQDKIYSNFVVGAIPTSSTLRLQVQSIGARDYHTVTLNGNFTSAFLFSYDIAIDPNFGGTGANTLERITRVTGDISNPSAMGTPDFETFLFTEGGLGRGSLISTVGDPGIPDVLSETALHVIDAYVPNGGVAVSISDTFLQEQLPSEDTPEPGTYALIGGGFLLVASLKRLRR